jgi:hypothetical protein
VCVCVCVLRGVRGGPIYTSGGRFPTKRTYGRWSGALATTPPRNAPGREAGQGFGRPHLGAPYPPLAGWQVGICVFPCVHYAWRARLLCQMGPPCKWVTPDAIFCVVVWRLLRVFVLFHSCWSEIIQTRKQLWSKVSDTNMWGRRIVFLY